MWNSGKRRPISKEDYEKIISGEKDVYDFFSEWEVMGYGAMASKPKEENGEYYIPYSISDTCD